ncbi:MAG: hypothetical protein JO197_17380 [Acidobacteria bacterium]|nr:hypothetical protein [Acidobacteriota bacterium]MBV9478403.1 hypothetical protein [Acidobacteriota bacterium]
MNVAQTSRGHRVLRIALALLLLFVAVGAKRRSVTPRGPAPLSLERSFVITDKSMLVHFRFQRVLETLIARSSAPDMTAEALYRQWFDTGNPKPGLDASMPHCDDEHTGGRTSLNGLPRRCPASEGLLATAAFRDEDFIPIAVTNRFDLADPAGAHCGEYRIVFARIAPQPLPTLHIIFEAVLPNPHPEMGLTGCRAAAQFWADLSTVDSLAERRARVERFFFDGIAGYEPVIHPHHYRHAPAGVRTMQGNDATLVVNFTQFRVMDDCTRGACRLWFAPDVLENLPFAPLFDSHDQSDRARRLRAAFLENVPTLATNDVNLYFMRIPPEFLAGDADPDGDGSGFLATRFYLNGLSTDEGIQFNNDLKAILQQLHSPLAPFDLLARAESQNCMGCHFMGGSVGAQVQFPHPAEGHQQITELRMEDGEEGPNTRYAISPAIRDVFGPHRMEILRAFLTAGTPPVHSQ